MNNSVFKLIKVIYLFRTKIKIIRTDNGVDYLARMFFYSINNDKKVLLFDYYSYNRTTVFGDMAWLSINQNIINKIRLYNYSDDQ